MLMICWALLGALIGVSAAQRRRSSVVAGILGGVLLGPLAVLLYWASGLTRSDQRRLCLYCLEWIKADAVVCKHCYRDLSQRRPQVRIGAARELQPFLRRQQQGVLVPPVDCRVPRG